ncbi:MAG: DUF4365 domain-containing protein [Nocardioides sp.]|nr:DUF4365 domain-containing protein [Nocardioides sp.]
MTAASTGLPSRPPLRGSPQRITNFMERLQAAYVRAVAASAGCNIVGEPEIDEGIDVMLSHNSVYHSAISDGTARLEIQLKATASPANICTNHIKASLSRERYDYFASANPSLHRIVIAMAMPKNQAHWTYSRPKGLSVHYQAYWVNLAGAPPATTDSVSIKVPRTQPFDDIALCDMMERIGQGGKP